MRGKYYLFLCQFSSQKDKFKKRHVQMFLIFIGIVLHSAIRVSLSVAIIPMTSYKLNDSNVQKFDWTPLQTALILSAFGWGYIVMQIPSAYLIHLYSNKLIFSVSTLICGLMHASIPILNCTVGWIAVLFSRIATGFFQGCIWSCSQNFISQWIPNEESKQLGLIMFIAADVGTVFGFLTAGFLTTSRFGWPSVFYSLGTIAVIWSIICYYKSFDSPYEHPTISREEMENISDRSNKINTFELSQILIPWKQILSSPAFWALAMSNCGIQWIRTVYFIELPTYLLNFFNFNLEESSFMSVLPFLATLISVTPITWIFDQLVNKGVSRSLVRKTANTISFWGLSATCVGLACFQFTNKTATMLLVIIGNCMNVCHFSGFIQNHFDIAPNFAELTMAIANTIGTVCSVLEPLINRMIVDDTTNAYQWKTYFMLTCHLLFLSNLYFLILSRFEIQVWDAPIIKSQINTMIDDEVPGSKRISIIEEEIILYI